MCTSFTCKHAKICMPLGFYSKMSSFLSNRSRIFISLLSFVPASATAFAGFAPVWYLRLQSLWDAGSHVLYIYLALWFINSLPSMRSTKNTAEAEHHMQHLARKGVCELRGDLSTQQLSAVASCTSGMIQGFRLPQYANCSLTQHLSDPVILYSDNTIQQVEHIELRYIILSI